ncbi:MAG: glycosyltransferase family 4 protein, partial [Coriobacteriia bacterium]|nr:glycosyltransferase family 4 protein [Coriobacteriia bacterium]
CHDTDTLQAGRRVADATRARLVYDAHELFPDMIAGHGRNSLFVQRYWRRVERRLVARSSAVITVSDSLAHVLRERYGVDPAVLRNVSSPEPLRRTDRLRRELGIRPGVPIVLYQGGLIGGRALVRLVRAMSSVPGAVLVFQGAGPEEAAIRREIASRGLAEQVMLTGWVHPSELHEYACSADVGVVIYENTSLNNYNASPNKLYGYLMAGLPMVASDFPGLREVVVGESVGTVFDPTDEESIAAAIRRLLEDPEALARMSATARSLAETRYNWDVESKKLLSVYESLAGHAP